jgi:hypothetical protein
MRAGQSKVPTSVNTGQCETRALLRAHEIARDAMPRVHWRFSKENPAKAGLKFGNNELRGYTGARSQSA